MSTAQWQASRLWLGYCCSCLRLLASGATVFYYLRLGDRRYGCVRLNETVI